MYKALSVGVIALLTFASATVASSAAPAAVAAASTPAPVQVRHVFQIVLENEEEPTSFPGTGSELDQLAAQGVFIPRYFGTGHASLDNYIAMISGQAQFTSTSQDCPVYRDASGTVDAKGFYVPVTPQDTGCVLPTAVKTLPDQLTAAHHTWRGYMEDMGNTPTRETSPCGQPALAGTAVDPTVGAPDQTESATAADQYAARHNPFVYFHTSIDGAGASPCAANVVPSTQLTSDLAGGTVADWNFITPNLCNDGHDAPCKGPGAEGANPGAGGLVSANAFLAQVVPAIQASTAYADGGLIIVTFDEGSSNLSCCGESKFSTGGGQVGAVLLGPALHAHVSSCRYNHFSLLRTWEDLFQLGTNTTGIAGSDRHGHLAHAGDRGVVPLTRELSATTNPCAHRSPRRGGSRRPACPEQDSNLCAPEGAGGFTPRAVVRGASAKSSECLCAGRLYSRVSAETCAIRLFARSS